MTQWTATSLVECGRLLT